jgi:Protein of unknown function (DUF4058)
MPIHDWTRVAAGIFHHFHHEWISEIQRALNAGLLPPDMYAMAEQQAAGYGPDVLTLQLNEGDFEPSHPISSGPATATLVAPKATYTAQTDAEFYRRKKSSVVIRHVSDDRIIAMVEIVSPGTSARAFRAFLDKTLDLLENRIHLLILDLFPPTSRDPHGIHAAIWGEVVDGGDYEPPPGKPLTLVAYESSLVIKTFVESVAVGDALPDMPLILEPNAAVTVPLEATYQRAWDAVPLRWRVVLEPPSL